MPKYKVYTLDADEAGALSSRFHPMLVFHRERAHELLNDAVYRYETLSMEQIDTVYRLAAQSLKMQRDLVKALRQLNQGELSEEFFELCGKEK